MPEPGGEHTVRFVDKLVKVELKRKPGTRQPLAAVAIFTTLNIADYSDEELIASENPFAYVLLTAKLGWIEQTRFRICF